MESDKARKQAAATGARLRVACEELDVLRGLKVSLEYSEQEWQKKVALSQSDLATMEKKYRETIPSLEKEMAVMMSQMDAFEAEEKQQREEEAKRSAAIATQGSSSSGAGAGAGAGARTEEVAAIATAMATDDDEEIEKQAAAYPPQPPFAEGTNDSSSSSSSSSSSGGGRIPKLAGRISPDAAELDEVHKVYPFVPNSLQVRPTPEGKEQKAAKLIQISLEYRNFVDFIYHTVFNCPVIHGEDSKKIVSNRHRAKVQREKLKLLQPQLFPYQNAGHHSVMWYSGEDNEKTDEEISADIHQELAAMLGSHDNFDFGWYVNPRMTVPEFFHVQVFWESYADADGGTGVGTE
jgi:hypothetical protein